MTLPPNMPRILPPQPVESETLRRDLAAAIRGPVFVADLLLQRGVRTASEARAFFLPEVAPTSEFPLLDLDRAVPLLQGARTRGEKVVVHGDYDVDGVTGTALLYMGLVGLGFKASWYLPNRFQGGYGLSRFKIGRAHV